MEHGIRLVRDLHVGVRVRRCLRSMGLDLEPVGRLADVRRPDMLRVRGFWKASLAELDAELTRIGMGPVGSSSWALAWRLRRDKGAARRVFAAVDAQTPEWRLAMITAFVEKAAEEQGGAGETDDAVFRLSDLTEGADGTYFNPHPRCYAAMILARDRQVAMVEPCDCFKFDGLPCPEHMVASIYDECFMCRGCGHAYGGCECDEATQDSIRDGRHHILV